MFQTPYRHDCLWCLYLAICWVSLLTLTRALWSILPPNLKVRQRRPGERMAAVASSAVAGCPQKLPCPDRSPLGMGGECGEWERRHWLWRQNFRFPPVPLPASQLWENPSLVEPGCSREHSGGSCAHRKGCCEPEIEDALGRRHIVGAQ